MILYFSPDITEDSAELLEDEFKHCCKVLRKGVGDSIFITDGNGTKARASIKNVNKNSAELEVLSSEFIQDSDHKIHIAVAPPKNRSRWEWFLEKSVEIGVNEIIPLKTFHSERSKLNFDRSDKIIRSAALQSQRYHHPSLSPITDLKSIFESSSAEKSNRYIAHYKESYPHLLNIKPEYNRSLLLIGPEGDFSKEELEMAERNAYIPVKLSENRLRTETAAIVALSYLITF